MLEEWGWIRGNLHLFSASFSGRRRGRGLDQGKSPFVFGSFNGERRGVLKRGKSIFVFFNFTACGSGMDKGVFEFVS